jgi:hypothetical protein
MESDLTTEAVDQIDASPVIWADNYRRGWLIECDFTLLERIIQQLK